MSFMFKPLAYDDVEAKNNIQLSDEITDNIMKGNEELAKRIINEGKDKVVLIDGYAGASIEDLIKEVKKLPSSDIMFVDIATCFKSEEVLEELFLKYLPLNYEEDPVLLFGYLTEDDYSVFFDEAKLKNLIQTVKNTEGTVILYGQGSSYEALNKISDMVVYLDVTPKVTAIRAREGKFNNIGSSKKIPFNLLMRRNYFVDFSIILKQRQHLIDTSGIDLYVIDSDISEYITIPFKDVKKIFNELVKSPFRAKPVYLEGIWGGEYIRKIRNIPKEIASNIAWIFEFIPMEVSIAVECGEHYLDFPFYTFLQDQKEMILGKSAYEKFGGYFPIRFNYDDTWHSDGNMSVQVHPNGDYAKKHYNELGSQDEAYYVIATGHGAKTYAGWKKDGREFLELSKKSEKDGSKIDYKSYIYGLDSNIGRQVMIPAGTIHASGQNQFILELGSLTVGSYTYKVYDYNRRDSEGNLRPIHTKKAEQILEFDRDEKWVHENIAIEPVLVENQGTSKEYLVGKTDLMYYQTHRIELETGGKYDGKNNGQFTVLTVVDGESVVIYSKSNPEFMYVANYLDIITVPAHIDDYVIESKSYQPSVIHKTTLV